MRSFLKKYFEKADQKFKRYEQKMLTQKMLTQKMLTPKMLLSLQDMSCKDKSKSKITSMNEKAHYMSVHCNPAKHRQKYR
tara:strand:- start:441 stop:680 length:240 start_codon:yes stop_codon:yes gene_type:complete